MLVPVLPMFEAAEDTTAAAKIQQAEKHIGFHNNNHRG